MKKILIARENVINKMAFLFYILFFDVNKTNNKWFFFWKDEDCIVLFGTFKDLVQIALSNK